MIYTKIDKQHADGAETPGRARRPWEVEVPSVYKMGMSGTKWEIFCCAVHLFAESDYSAVSMRTIAHHVGVAVSSLYVHFLSKEVILSTIFAYCERFMNPQPNSIEYYLHRAETDPPRQVLASIHAYYDPHIQILMSKIILIAFKMIRCDPRADAIMYQHLYVAPRDIYRATLARLIELNRIEPMDVDGFTEVICNVCWGAAMRMYSNHPIDPDLWRRLFQELFARVQPTGV
jgi:AcrR family transcriptional regulator